MSTPQTTQLEHDMNSQQIARLAYLDSVEFQTPAEEAEHAHLLRLHSDMQQAFDVLTREGFHPTWVGGEHIVANVPSIRSLPGGKTARFTEPEIVRSLAGALRLVHACA
jgi:hypothetical protein